MAWWDVGWVGARLGEMENVGWVLGMLGGMVGFWMS